MFPIAPQAITAGDVNGDGKQDVVVGNRGLDILDGEVWLLAGDGTGLSSPPGAVPDVTVLAPAFLDLVDLDGDGILDVIEVITIPAWRRWSRSPGAASACASPAGMGQAASSTHRYEIATGSWIW